MNERGTIYRFGEYELCTQTRELLHNGKRVEVQELIFCLLAYMVENSHRAVSKSELAASIWEDKPISETVIPRAIMKARRAIGDDSDPPDIIRTIRGYGYHFTATPEVIVCPEPDPNADPTVADDISINDRAGTPMQSARVARLRKTPGYGGMLCAFVAVLLTAGILVGQYRHSSWYGGNRGSVIGEDQQSIAALKLSPGASSTEHLQAMTNRITALLAHRLSNVPWIDIIHFSEENQPADADDKRLYILAFSLTESGGRYSIEYTLNIPDMNPIRGTLTDERPGLIADELVTIVTGFTEESVGY